MLSLGSKTDEIRMATSVYFAVCVYEGHGGNTICFKYSIDFYLNLIEGLDFFGFAMLTIRVYCVWRE